MVLIASVIDRGAADLLNVALAQGDIEASIHERRVDYSYDPQMVYDVYVSEADETAARRAAAAVGAG